VWPALAPYDPDITDVHQDTVAECVEPFSKILDSVLVRPWDAYKERGSEQKRELKIINMLKKRRKMMLQKTPPWTWKKPQPTAPPSAKGSCPRRNPQREQNS
jgi:hypothetical protein